MSRTATPLRYPGGKTILSTLFCNTLEYNNMKNTQYIEPYAGGAGAALKLLSENKVCNVVLNDANIAIFSFWESVTNSWHDFMELFESTQATLSEWEYQKEIFSRLIATEPSKSSVELGFATFFLNRCNHSGILDAGPIGGRGVSSQKEAKWKLDARYNKTNLRKRLHKIYELRKRITATNMDALNLLKSIENGVFKHSGDTLIYLDPPYYKQGKRLYLDYYKESDHSQLKIVLNSLRDVHWILSYDNIKEIGNLYSNHSQYTFDLNYSVNKRQSGSELLIHSNNLNLPPDKSIPRANGKHIKLNAVSCWENISSECIV